MVRLMIRKIRYALNYFEEKGFSAFLLRLLYRYLGYGFIVERLLVRTIPTPRAQVRLAKVNPATYAGATVSVVIPTWNGIKDGIENLLKSLRAQTIENLEIVAVDSGSTDGTLEVLENYTAIVIPINKNDFRHDYARNLGAQRSTGEYILFTVQDAVFDDRSWIATALKHLHAFGATSYSTPQRCGPSADVYARYLAYNFLSVNRYCPGVNLCGNRLMGRVLFSMADERLRERVIHVDDTNHLVRRDFFIRHPLSFHTCEDMEFGRTVIRSNQLFVYSTLSYVTHFHSYRNQTKYFIRIFADNQLIHDLVGSGAKPRVRPGRVDAVLQFGFFLTEEVEKCVERYRSMGVKRVVLAKGWRDVASGYTKRETEQVYHFRIVEDFVNRMLDIDHAAFTVLDMNVSSAPVRQIIDNLGLAVDPNQPSQDFGVFRVLRERFTSHLRVSSRILADRLGYADCPIDEYAVFLVTCSINVLVSELSYTMNYYIDESSKNIATLSRLVWV